MIIYIILHREIPHRLPDYFAIYSIVGYSADYIRITHKPAIQNLYNSYCLCALHVAPLSAYRVYGLPSPFSIAALLLCVALGVERWRRVSTEGFRSRAKVCCIGRPTFISLRDNAHLYSLLDLLPQTALPRDVRVAQTRTGSERNLCHVRTADFIVTGILINHLSCCL